KNLMAEMKLLGMLAAFDKTLSDATRDQSSHSELIDTLLQAECDYRQERKTGNRIKAAKFTLRSAFGHRLHRQPLDQQDADQRALQPAMAARRQTGAPDRPDRRRQNLPRPGRGTACLRLQQIRAVYDADHVAREPRARTL